MMLCLKQVIRLKILIINGPNLNLLGKRDESQYGAFTLDTLNELINSSFVEIEFEFFQSNYEGAIIDKLHGYHEFDGIVINPGAFTHYSYAIRDAIEPISIPVIEAHISNVYAREDFRKKSVVSDVCVGKISGLREYSYLLGVEYLVKTVGGKK